MGMKDVFKRYLVFVIGLYFLAAGIVLIVRSVRNHTYIQHQLCVKPEQPFIIRNLYVSDQYAAYSGTVLDHQKK